VLIIVFSRYFVVAMRPASVIEYRKGARLPGAAEVTLETLPGSTLPDELRELGYDVREAGEGQRLMANAIVQKLALTSSGAFEERAEGSTKPLAQIRTHAGIVKVERYMFAVT
jgi:hypothetical protein